ncbi:MAG: alpha-L-fucosidase [Kiritimatiellae bacterium]|nr:alpha-L-fucosidase [Kiritimatiellia bacterium]
MKRRIIMGALLACTSLSFAYEANWESIDKRPIPEWWQKAKFGIFIHWGLYAVPAYAPTEGKNVYAKYSEHYDNRLRTKNEAFVEFHKKFYGDQKSYSDFAGDFKAEHFDPAGWAELFKRAGARYVVLTSKHHDGFALWPSQFSPRWNSVFVGPHRDLAGDLSQAVKAAGLHMGFYYSLLEWGNPLYSPATIDRWVAEVNLPQMKELVTLYQPEIVWTDGEWDFEDTDLRSVDFLAWLYNESPVKESVVVNDRWGKKTRGKHGGHYTTEYDLVHSTSSLAMQNVHPWEECRGIGSSFGFNQFETTEHYMTAAQCIETLIEKVSRGGNLLLNIGPQANGLIPVVMQERLLAMGQWLNVNGEAIYETTAWDDRPATMQADKVYYTKKPGALYAICTSWPQRPLVVPKIAKADSVTLLGSELKVDYKCEGGQLIITPPPVNPGTVPCEHAWTFKIIAP